MYRQTALWLLAAFIVVTAGAHSAARGAAQAGQGPSLGSIGQLAFAPDGTLFAADNQRATIVAFDLGAQATAGQAGARDLEALDQKLAGLLGTAASEVSIADMVVHPTTRNVYVSAMRGQGAGAAPALFRIDGAGQIALVDMSPLRFQSVELPNAPEANPGSRRDPRASVITDMEFAGGKLWVAGLSNEEFASKLRAIPYPFSSVDAGTSVEIFHGNHGQLETRSPVNAFVPYEIDGQPYLLAGYTCTPLVKFPIADLAPGAKVRGTTIGEFGAGNRVLDMIVYRKDGQEFLLSTNNSRGVMKVPTRSFAGATPITARVETETGGVAFETIAGMNGIVQMDKLDEQRTIVLARAASGALNLQVLPLP